MIKSRSASGSGSANPEQHRRARWQRITFVLLLLAAALAWIAHPLWLPALYDYLDVSTAPSPADCIVILGGNLNFTRVRTAIELYRQGYSDHILISGSGETLQEDMAQLSVASIPPDALYINSRATSTWNEAQQVLALLEIHGAHSALIVTDNVHTRRARATYAALNTQAIDLTFVAAQNYISRQDWWQSEDWRVPISNEYIKMGYYWLIHHIWSW